MRPPALVAIALIAIAVTGCSRTMPIYNVSSAPIAVPSKELSEGQGQDAIIEAKTQRLSAASGRGAIIEAKTEEPSATHVGDAITEVKTGQLSAAQPKSCVGAVEPYDEPKAMPARPALRRGSPSSPA